MIAEVYPLSRLPRTKRHFDYLVPDEMAIARGTFVRVPYRQQILWGIVRSVKDKPPRGITLKRIERAHPSAALREEELSFFEWLAHDLAQSVSSVLFASLPRPPSRESARVRPAFSWLPLTLPRVEAEQVARIVKTLSARRKTFVQTPDIRRAAAVILGYLQKHPEQKLLILAPTVRDVQLIRSRLSGVEPLVITGQESNNERFASWQAFRARDSGVLLGTRTALLAIDASITTIFLLRAADAAHKSADRNPRYDARRLVWQHHEQFLSNLFCLDVAPQSATVHQFDELERVSWGVYPDVRVVSSTQEKSASALRSTGFTAVQAIATCLAQGKQALCVYNRKGAGELRCADCLHRFVCPDCASPMGAFSHTMECARCRHKEPLALRCPSCRRANMRTFNPGNLEVARELQAQFPEASVAVIDKEHPSQRRADILLVTTFYYEALFDPFHKSDIGLVVHLDTDAPLYAGRPEALDEMMRDVWQWAWLGFGSRAPVVLQSGGVDLATSMMRNPFVPSREELEARERYHLPPFYRWAKISYRHDEDPRKAQIALQELTRTLQELPEAIVHASATDTHKSPTISCGVPLERFDAVLDIFTSLPDRYIIDTDVFS